MKRKITFSSDPKLTEADYLEQQNATNLSLVSKHGASKWENIQPGDFGPSYDFELENHINKFIITPVSNAAVQWLYRYLPSDCPRWGACGYVVETRYLQSIVNHMRRDRLMSPDDYNNAMEENAALQMQGEAR